MTWIMLGGMFGWEHFNADGLSAGIPGVTVGKPGVTSFDAGNVFQGWIRGLGAIYFAGETWSGCMMLVAMTFFSRISAAMMLMGSMVGIFAGKSSFALFSLSHVLL